MLFDKKWGLDEVGMLLLAAADYMEEHGWCQGAYTRDGKVCLIGALKEVSSDNFEMSMIRLQKAIPFDKAIPHWNDDVCKSKEGAVAKLREAAWLRDI